MNIDKNKPMSFPVAMRDFFGYRAGDTLKDFQAELKALSSDDKSFFRAGLEQNGYTLTPAGA